MDTRVRNFLNRLSRGGEYGHYWSISSKGHPNMATTWYSAGDVDKEPEAKKWRNVYFGVNPVSEIPKENRKGETKPPAFVRSQIKHIAGANCLFSEFDAKDNNGSKAETLTRIEALEIGPSVIVDSGGGYHCYWLLDEMFTDIDTLQDYQARWVLFTGGDKGAKDVARVLRVPGTRNYKDKYGPNYPVVSLVTCDLELEYAVETLVDAMPEPAPAPIPMPIKVRMISGGADRRERYWVQAVESAVGVVAMAQNGCKHTSLYGAAFLLGGYVAGGMGNAEEAHSVLEAAIRSKPGVKSVRAAISTIEDGVRDGASRPITFESKEDEFMEWKRKQGIVTPGSRAVDSRMVELSSAAVLEEGAGDKACPWLDDYIEFSRHWSPRAFDGFHEACGLFLLSTVAARRVTTHLGGERFPSLYIALAARTSLYAKTTTAMIARQVLKAVDMEHFLAPDDSTPQAFIQSLTSRVPGYYEDMSEDQKMELTDRLGLMAARGWFYEEFGQKLAQMMREGGFMADFRGHIRRFDDSPDRYEYTTIGRGRDIVEKPYLSLLANMTPADMRGCAKRGASMWGDGFWARFAFITPGEGKGSRARFPEGERIIPDSITEPLVAWHDRLGLPEVTIYNAANDPLEGSDDKNKKASWRVVIEDSPPMKLRIGDGVTDAFYRYNDAMLDIIEACYNQDFDGNYVRFPEKALRIAMLLASVSGDAVIEMCHWARAQEITERWREGLHSLYDQVDEAEATESEAMEERVIKLVGKKGPITARMVGIGIRGLDSTAAGVILDSLCGEVLEKKKAGRTHEYTVVGQGK